MAAYTGKRFFARFSRQFALALTLALTGTIGAVGIKIDNDILRVDQDQQQSATMVVKEIDKTLLQPTEVRNVRGRLGTSITGRIR